MTPTGALTFAFAAAWLTAMFFAWAFVHGAQKLRRQEVAALIATDQEMFEHKTATVTSIVQESETLQLAA